MASGRGKEPSSCARRQHDVFQNGIVSENNYTNTVIEVPIFASRLKFSHACPSLTRRGAGKPCYYSSTVLLYCQCTECQISPDLPVGPGQPAPTNSAPLKQCICFGHGSIMMFACDPYLLFGTLLAGIMSACQFYCNEGHFFRRGFRLSSCGVICPLP
jgi:hypothetical protein